MKITFNDVLKTFKDSEWKQFVCNIGYLKIYKINGAYVRSHLNIEFELGGHSFVYDHIPDNEIWVEAMPETLDMVFNLMHELYERNLMKIKHYNYDQAHDEAANFEKRLRKIYDAKQAQESLEPIIGFNIFELMEKA